MTGAMREEPRSVSASARNVGLISIRGRPRRPLEARVDTINCVGGGGSWEAWHAASSCSTIVAIECSKAADSLGGNSSRCYANMVRAEYEQAGVECIPVERFVATRVLGL